MNRLRSYNGRVRRYDHIPLFRIFEGLFNPAVTLGMILVGALSIVRAICLFVAQISGSIAVSAMVLDMFPTPLNVRTMLAGGASLV